jgi:hypothetical protein
VKHHHETSPFISGCRVKLWVLRHGALLKNCTDESAGLNHIDPEFFTPEYDLNPPKSTSDIIMIPDF